MKFSEETGKENPFRVPEDYFATLADRTMATIREAEAAGQEVGQLSKQPVAVPGDAGSGKRGRIVRLKPFLALAAAILGFAILATALTRLINADRPGRVSDAANSLFADLAAEEIDIYMLEDVLNMTETVIPEITEEAISSEAIIDYLMTEDILLDDIYELL